MERSATMVIGERLRTVRHEKKLLQKHIEERTGLSRCYVSRVERSHTVPAVSTLEKFARALQVPLYQILYDGDEPPQFPAIVKTVADREMAWGSSGDDARFLHHLRQYLARMAEQDRNLLLFFLEKMALLRNRTNNGCPY
jgi:transcriptional regulator with XRE-family HTH domain